MRQLEGIYIEPTIFNNLPSECLVMVKSFYPTYDIELREVSTLCFISVDTVLEDSFFVRIHGRCVRFNIREGFLYNFQESIKPISLLPLQKDIRYFIKIAIYTELVKLHGKSLPWGILQGIRPVKLVYKIYHWLKNDEKQTLSVLKEPIVKQMILEYFVSQEMAELAFSVALNEEVYLPKSIEIAREKFSIYISIPFCPTRCHYCSFPSNTLEHLSVTVMDYLDALLKEWDAIIPSLLKERSASCLYIGGGTPTTLTHEELDYLLGSISQRIDLSLFEEITCEAGRPDTIDREKLLVLKKYGVHRISINPQTMHQKTLNVIGRKHSIDEILGAYQLAMEVGLTRVNMDLILGLPNETIEDIMYTVKAVCDLNPEEVTIHTLAIKRSSSINEHREDYRLPTETETNAMVEWTIDYMRNVRGYQPYYLYRQKNMVVSHENIGYFKGKLPCIYNIEIMEEVIPIVAFGAGAITKEIDLQGNPSRCENVKNVEIYIERIDEMIQRKKKSLFL